MAQGTPPARIARLPDPLTPAQRRHNMSRIRASDTKPELILRRLLHAAGLRYRLHDRRLPGTPDIAMAGRRVAIFVHGCFWHGHDCPKGVTPGTNTAFWVAKIRRNRERDEAASGRLMGAGWRVLTVWECALRGRARREPAELTQIVIAWCEGDDMESDLAGQWSASGLSGIE
jgi:DNA mismatch endonuclease, patch repair protein